MIIMNDLPSLELLESTHAFPGPYMFKVIGLADQGFVARTVAAVRLELVDSVDPPFTVRASAGGRHVAVTLHPTVHSPDQVLAIYARLRCLVGLVVLW